MELRTYREGDGDRLRTFWLTCGIKIRPGDDDAALARFAERNPGLFLLAEEDGHLVGSALAGWDGRRGWLYHVAVHKDERRRGIGGQAGSPGGGPPRPLPAPHPTPAPLEVN